MQERGLPGISASGTIKAFKSGSQVGATVAIDFNSGTTGLKSFSSNPDFYDVDEVRIEGLDLYIILDEITYNVPFIIGANDPAVVTGINLVGAPISTASSVQYQVDFSKIAKNVSSDDFALTTTGTAAGTIGAVSGSNATYTVPITGISGEGTIRLDLKSGTNIANENDVTGTAAFTSGQIHNVSPCLIEDFEDETIGSTIFSYGGYDFSVTSGNMEVHTELPSSGINGSKNLLINTGVGSYTITSNSGEINLRKFAVYLSSEIDGMNPTNDGSITVVGKNSGSQVYSVSKVTGFPTDFSANSGYYIFDLASEGGTDNSKTAIDELVISLGASFQYINIDNFEFCADDVAPSGYSVSIDQDPITQDNEGAVSFTFADAEIGATYNYTFSSTGGGPDATGSGTISTATDQIIGIDLSGLGVGTVTLSVTLTDASSNTGSAAIDTAIKKINATITVIRASGDYNGNPFEATGSATGLDGELSPSVTFEYQEYDGSTWSAIVGAPTNAGAYRVRSNFAGNTNYNSGSSDWTDFDINKINAILTVIRSSGDYNGNPFVATGGVTGLAGVGLIPSVTFEYQEYNGSTWTAIVGAPTNAGDYRVRSNFTGNTNYNAGFSDWTAFAINKIAATITVIRSSGDYNGNTYVATGGVTGLEGELSPSVTFEYQEYDGSTWTAIVGAPTTVGAYRVRSNFVGNTNYNAGSSDWTSFAINKIDATITVTGYTGTYDGAVHGATGSATGLAGEILAGLDLGASFTNVPGGTAYWTFTDVTGNYNDDNGSVVIGITMAPTTITISNALANCDGGQVTLTATVKTVNTGIQSDVNSLGGVVTFKTGSTTIGNVNVASVTDGVFSGTFTISLTPGSPYPISAEFVPNSGNLSDSQTQATAQLTVFEAFVSSSIPKNANGNVVIFDGAASSLGLPSSTTLTATYQPSPYSGLSYKWYERNEGGSFTLISGSNSSTYQIVANGDFVKEYKVELIVDGQCVGNEIFSKVISVEASCGKAGQNKVQVCQIMSNGKRKTICVSANAVEALLAGSPGSFIGNCNVTYRMEEEPELIAVPWNTPLEVINDKIVSQSENWFDSKKIKLTINTESYNALQPGFYEMKVDLQENEWFVLEEPITVNVLVADKPLATDIKLSNSILLRNIHNGSLIGDLRTIDPVDDQHTYSFAEHADFELVGHSLIWKGTSIPATARITVFSTDRAGQRIERVIELSREPRFGDFIMFPNPAHVDVNLEVELDQSMNVGIRIYDAIGRLVYQEEGIQDGIATYQIAIDHLSPGLYTVQVKTGILVMNKRLIKK